MSNKAHTSTGFGHIEAMLKSGWIKPGRMRQIIADQRTARMMLDGIIVDVDHRERPIKVFPGPSGIPRVRKRKNAARKAAQHAKNVEQRRAENQAKARGTNR